MEDKFLFESDDALKIMDSRLLASREYGAGDDVGNIYDTIIRTNHAVFNKQQALLFILKYMHDNDNDNLNKHKNILTTKFNNDKNNNNKPHLLSMIDDIETFLKKPTTDNLNINIEFLKWQITSLQREWKVWADTGNLTCTELNNNSKSFLQNPNISTWRNLTKLHNDLLSKSNNQPLKVWDYIIRCCYIIYFCFSPLKQEILMKNFYTTNNNLEKNACAQFKLFFEIPETPNNDTSPAYTQEYL